MGWTLDSLRRLRAKRRVHRVFKRRLGYTLNLRQPRSYCEKLQWLKFYYHEHMPEVIRCSDKFEVRSFLEQRGLGSTLPELYGVWETPGAIDWAGLPQRFVLKRNNGSGKQHIWFVKDKGSFDKAQCMKQIERLSRQPYGFDKGEFHYAKIQPRILAEQHLGDDIADYKFYCFNGTIGFLSVESGRYTGNHTRGYYDEQLEPVPIRFFDDLPGVSAPALRPRGFEEMVALAKQLSAGHPMVRVDLYNIDGQVYFGELTFSPECGYTKWDPLELDFEFGERIDLDLARRQLASASVLVTPPPSA